MLSINIDPHTYLIGDAQRLYQFILDISGDTNKILASNIYKFNDSHPGSKARIALKQLKTKEFVELFPELFIFIFENSACMLNFFLLINFSTIIIICHFTRLDKMHCSKKSQGPI
jgi:hypothetical protein